MTNENDKKPANSSAEPARADAPPEKLEANVPIEESKPAPPKFIFKIVKADPKNSFDFEDVADK